VAEVTLMRDGSAEDHLAVGAPQDADAGQSAAILPGGGWSDPASGEEIYRSVSGPDVGEAQFHLWFFYARSDYELELRYRSASGGRMRVFRGERLVGEAVLPETPTWTRSGVRLIVEDEQSEETGGAATAAAAVSRWPGEGTFLIESVQLLDEAGVTKAIFEAGTALAIRVRSRASASGRFPVTPAATIYRVDGVLVTNLVGTEFDVDAVDGSFVDFRLDYGRLNLGNGRYTISIALYRRLSHVVPSEMYDLLDRSYEFEVQGNKPFDNGVFSYEPEWSVSAIALQQGAEATRT
jgi:hypothetical protein